MYKHILLEVYCGYGWDSDKTTEFEKCKSDGHIPSYECLYNKCPYVSFTSHENALCYIGDDSCADKIISVGNEVANGADTEKWRKIAHKKIDEAFCECFGDDC